MSFSALYEDDEEHFLVLASSNAPLHVFRICFFNTLQLVFTCGPALDTSALTASKHFICSATFHGEIFVFSTATHQCLVRFVVCALVEKREEESKRKKKSKKKAVSG